MNRFIPLLVIALGLGVVSTAQAEADPAVVEALEEYFDFADYGSGQITVEQIPAADYANFYILDVRDAEQFAKGHIPGAVNIEWRKVFAQRADLPKDKTILAYCNSGSFASQVAQALRLDGFSNVRLLYGGYERWLQSQKPAKP
jgi:rhodanese-related sulfurtransferase